MINRSLGRIAMRWAGVFSGLGSTRVPKESGPRGVVRCRLRNSFCTLCVRAGPLCKWLRGRPADASRPHHAGML